MIISLSLPSDLVAEIRKTADENRRKISVQADIWLRQAIKERDRQREKNKKKPND